MKSFRNLRRTAAGPQIDDPKLLFPPVYDELLLDFLSDNSSVHQRPLYFRLYVLAFKLFCFISCIPGVAYGKDWRNGWILFE